MGLRIAMLVAIGFAVGLGYAGALLALDVAGLGALVARAGLAMTPIFLLGAALSFMPVVLSLVLATLPDERPGGRNSRQLAHRGRRA